MTNIRLESSPGKAVATGLVDIVVGRNIIDKIKTSTADNFDLLFDLSQVGGAFGPTGPESKRTNPP